MTKFRTCGMLTLLALVFLAAGVAAAGEPTAANALRAAVAVQRALPRAPQLPRTDFLDARALSAVTLSPAGDFVAWLREHGESRSLVLLPTAGGKARILVGRTQARQLLWSRDGRWLFLRAPDSLSTVSAEGRAGVRVPLGGAEQRQLMKVDPSRPAAVLMRERIGAGGNERWRIVRMDVGGKRSVLREDPRWVHDVALDAAGRIVALARFEGDHDALHRVRPDGALREVLRLRPMERVGLLAVLPAGGLLLEGNPGGDFRRVLRLDADDRLHTLHEDPRGEADLDEVVLDPRTSLPLAASYRSTVAATYGIGAAAPVVAAIARRLPGRDIAVQAGSAASSPWLVSERAATLRDPRWYLFDPRGGGLRRILDEPVRNAHPPSEARLARKLAVSYLASDGLRVHGFLLLPPGVDPARAPLIAQVHGGPINHFRPGFDGVAQFLANRGYVVFQSNFRGSTGHGRAYTFASNGDYGNGRVQQDIEEGVRWLLARGIGDAQRVGIVGHSFGGYSALLGLTFQPELFKVGVAGAPPADLGWAMRWLLASGEQGDLPDRSLQQTLRALSLDAGDPATFARLHAQSPLANASKMRRPLLVMAGGADRTVAIREVTHYVATLKAQGSPVTLLVEPGGGHSPLAPVAREAYLFAMETMLQRHLGGPEPDPPGQRLRAYLRGNLRLAGPEFTGFANRPAR
ncbi:prolyl oligopeptidase family serine peptidase [Thermomonas sp. XSG]|jgi:dienelactone hydrolase|uniref:S9 family peptidase n=1 Tax=Thermomonas sp. XSG TaxID=2771436 RepID=UPI001680E282|nr:prolyl oligopeptidase family serine peptidase [Thermomonas sp. XSG]QNU15765.1 S9 family peptidase [Thermomonas sp. XSG]